MKARRMAVVGLGATGTVLAAALLSKYPETVLVVRKAELVEELGSRGITVSGTITLQAPMAYWRRMPLVRPR